MDDLEKIAIKEAERQQEATDWFVKWFVDPIAVTILITGLSLAVANSSDPRKTQKRQIVDVRDELRYQPIQPVKPATYQVETQNQEYFPERPQI